MDTTFRFLHASDLHLEHPPGGLAEIPDHLRAAMTDAVYRSAARVFEAAIKHHVDFILLCGDVLDVQRAGPRGIVFLEEQFEKLAAAGIRVYWAGSPLDRFERWTHEWTLPSNVHRFATDRVEQIIHQRAGEPLVLMLGTSMTREGRVPTALFDTRHSELFSVAAAYGTVGVDSLSDRGIDYWALGGEHARQSLLAGTVTVHYCGSPLGRNLREAGPRGCTLVHVDDTRRVRTTFVPTDAIRYCDERIALDESAPRDELFRAMSERLAEHLIDPFGPELLVEFHVIAPQSLTAELRSPKFNSDLVARLRTEHGGKRPGAWTVRIKTEPIAPPADLFEEETLLGEFLRSARLYAEHPDEPLSLEGYLAERHLAGRLSALASLNDTELRREVLAEATALGVDLLHPQGDRS